MTGGWDGWEGTAISAGSAEHRDQAASIEAVQYSSQHGPAAPQPTKQLKTTAAQDPPTCLAHNGGRLAAQAAVAIKHADGGGRRLPGAPSCSVLIAAAAGRAMLGGGWLHQEVVLVVGLPAAVGAAPCRVVGQERWSVAGQERWSAAGPAAIQLPPPRPRGQHPASPSCPLAPVETAAMSATPCRRMLVAASKPRGLSGASLSHSCR